MDWIHSYNKRSNENSIRGLEPTVSLYFLSLLEFPEELLVIKGLILRTLVSRARCPASGTGRWELPQAGRWGGSTQHPHSLQLVAVGGLGGFGRMRPDKERKAEESSHVKFILPL